VVPSPPSLLSPAKFLLFSAKLDEAFRLGAAGGAQAAWVARIGLQKLKNGRRKQAPPQIAAYYTKSKDG
jgi:hypothetical protein